MKRTLILIIALIGVINTSNAQDSKKSVEKKKYVAGGILDNWFVSVGAGLGSNIAKNSGLREASLFEELDDHGLFQLDAAVGKWINPYFGARIHYSGHRMRTNVVGYPRPHNWNSTGLSANIMFNASSIFAGHKNERFYNLVPFVGYGIYLSGEGEKTTVAPIIESSSEPFIVGGLINRFRITKCLDVNFELRASSTEIKYVNSDHVSGEKLFPVAATLGLGYNFGKHYARDFKERDAVAPTKSHYKEAIKKSEPVEEVVTPTEAEPIKESKVVATTNTEATKKIEEVEEKPSTVEAVKVVPAAKATTSEPTESEPTTNTLTTLPSNTTLSRSLFEINSAQLSADDMKSIAEAAERIKGSTNNFIIIGNADATTGTTSYNKQLSLERANAVYNTLINKYGISPSRLTVKANGGNNEYEQIELNRFAIISVQ